MNKWYTIALVALCALSACPVAARKSTSLEHLSLPELEAKIRRKEAKIQSLRDKIQRYKNYDPDPTTINMLKNDERSREHDETLLKYKEARLTELKRHYQKCKRQHVKTKRARTSNQP